MKKLTYEEVAKRFKERGFTLISIYVNSRTKLNYICPNGHRWNTQLSNFYGWGCPTCSGNKKYTFEEIKEKFEKDGYRILSNKVDYKNRESLIKYKCINNHITTTKAANIMNGCRCQQCWYKYELSKRMTGESSPQWNPELTEEHREKNKRRYGNYLNWKKEILKRDNYICQLTGLTGKVAVHHLDGYRENNDKRYTLDNGITLLKEIHDEFHNRFHNRFGRGNNTKEQFEKFKLIKKVDRIKEDESFKYKIRQYTLLHTFTKIISRRVVQ